MRLKTLSIIIFQGIFITALGGGYFLHYFTTNLLPLIIIFGISFEILCITPFFYYTSSHTGAIKTQETPNDPHPEPITIPKKPRARKPVQKQIPNTRHTQPPALSSLDISSQFQKFFNGIKEKKEELK